jgi:glucokinase
MADVRIGLDVWPGNIRGVVIDEQGAIGRRFQRNASDAAAIEAAVAELRGNAAVTTVGIASADVEVPRHVGPGVAASSCMPGAAAVTAETWIGAGRGARNAVCLWIGDRVLAGILLDGKPWQGANGLAGAAAYLALNPVERQDYRRFGSLAAEVSNTGIARRLSWRIQAGDHSAVLERAGDVDAITATHVFDGARAGDGVAISVVRDTAKYIGMAVANFASILDPEIVVLSGALAGAGDLLLEPVRQECARRLPPLMQERFRLEISPLGDYGVAVGAARLATPGT